MKRLIILVSLIALTQTVWAQNEIGPEGHKLLWFAVILSVAILLVLLFFIGPFKAKRKIIWPRFSKKKVSVELKKDALYYPDELILTVKNEGEEAVDIEQPMLVFSSIWVKRKFRIKGTNNASFYPLYLDKEQSHTLTVDLNRFYAHSKSLKQLPKVKVVIFEVNGRRLGSQSVYLRKTLFKF
ncbi:MAG: hypothetical protein ACOC13_01095 [Tangfeifania sp.]